MKMVKSTDGVEIAVHRLGGRGPIVLLVHGNGMCGQTFSPLAASLAPRFRSVAPDLRGHGDSITPAGISYDWRGFADDVTAVVRALDNSGSRRQKSSDSHAGAETDDHTDLGSGSSSGSSSDSEEHESSGSRPPVYAVGHSLGGAAVMRAEQLHPGLFTAIYCFEPVVIPAPASADHDGSEGRPASPEPSPADDPIGARRLARLAFGRQQSFASVVDAYAAFAARPPFDALDPAALWAYVTHGFATLADGSLRLKCPGSVEARIYQMASANGVFEALGDIRCPVTIGVGDQSRGGPARFARAVADAIPNGRLERFDDLGHFGPLQDPDRIAESIGRAFA